MIFSKLLNVFKDRRKVFELLVGLSLLVVLSGVAAARWLDPFELLFLDLRFQLRGEKAFPQEITVIGFDEASLDVLGRWPWPRDRHANLLSLLTHESFRPSLLGYDVLFENKNNNAPKGDEALAYETKKIKDRLILSYFFEKGQGAAYEHDIEKEKRLEDFALPHSTDFPEHLETYNRVSLPYIEVAESSSLAFVNTPVDSDGRTRRAQLLGMYDGKIYPSLDLIAAVKYWGAEIKDIRLKKRSIEINTKSGKKMIPISSKGEMLIHYYGGSSSIPSASMIEVLKAGSLWMKGQKPAILTSLKDKIVLVGVTALGIGDRRVTPYLQYEPGITLHAQTVGNIIHQDFLTRNSLAISLALLFVVGFLAIFSTMFLKITYSIPAGLTLQALYFGVAYLFFLKGLWIDVAIHEISVAVVFIGITCYRYFTALEELKRTQEQLIQSAKMASLGQLSAGIAHEFRNILNAITLNVECCSTPNLPPERLQKYLAMYKKTALNANMILEGLLVFARKSESVKRPGNLKKTLEDALLLVEKDMMRHEIKCDITLEEVPEISYDAGQISQVMMNMMNNSRDALKDRPNKQISLKLYQNEDKICMDIGDNGSGIPPQVLKRLFEPFVTSKPAGKGTGLGLSVCHGIIRNHGGEIKVTTAQDQGTTWHITLPKG
jgi:signal transduction histidine kinase